VLAQPGQVIFAQVNQLIHARGWQVKELDVERGRLDEVFRSLTRGEVA
jgi:ABC-2 type transport system ATP-binding protein